MDSIALFKKLEQIRVNQLKLTEDVDFASTVPASTLVLVSSLLQQAPITDQFKEKLKAEFKAILPAIDFSLCNEATYFKLLAYAKVMYAEEKNGIAEDHAYKLAVIFSDERKAIKYLRDFLNANPNTKQLMHDACLFALPKGDVDWPTWQKLSDKFMKDELYRKHILPQATELEKMIKAACPKDKTPKPSASDIKQATKKFEELNSEVKDLRRHHHQDLIQKSQELLDARQALVDISMPFNDSLTLTALSAFKDTYVARAAVGFEIFLKNGLTKGDYERFSALKRQDDDRCIPNIKIAGKETAAGFYIMKVPLMDEAHAARAACFGKLTNCCQSLSGEAGEPCVIHGLTSPNGGFYVVCQGDINNPKVSDKVIGQCWAWRSDKGAIVFDSIEVARGSVENTEGIVRDFFRNLALEIVEKGHANKVACGANSGISRTVGANYYWHRHEKFHDYSGYTDSREQLLLCETATPYLFYDKNTAYKKATEKYIQEIMQIQAPLEKSSEFSKMINWVLINNATVLEKIKEIAAQYNRLTELEEMIDNIKLYINGKLSNKQIDTLIDQGKLYACAFDTQGNTPLMLALNDGDSTIALKLLEHDIPLDTKNVLGDTALMNAAKKNNQEVFAKLLKKGADVNAGDSINATPLIWALAYGNNDIALKLIEANANVNARSDGGHMALLIAAKKGFTDIALKLIEKGGRVDAADNEYNSILHLALKKGHSETALMFIDKGVNIYAHNAQDQSAIMLAVEQDFQTVTAKLIAKGASLNGALINAADKGNVDLLSKLLDKGADVNAKDEDEVSALMRAAGGGHVDAMLKLIEKGANLNTKNIQGGTALMWAAARGHEQIVIKLIEYSVDVNAVSNDGRTAYALAVAKGHSEIAKRLQEASEKKAQPLQTTERKSPLILSDPSKSLEREQPENQKNDAGVQEPLPEKIKRDGP